MSRLRVPLRCARRNAAPLATAGLLLACLPVIPNPARGARPAFLSDGRPDGVCVPVHGEGVLKSSHHRFEIGNLTPVYRGDSVFVTRGSITLVDFRIGDRSTGRAGQVLTLDAREVRGGKTAWERFKELLAKRLSGPERRRNPSGSTRNGQPPLPRVLWPDGETHAADVAVVLQWDGVEPPPVKLRVRSGARDTTIALPGAEATGARRLDSGDMQVGRVVWQLLDPAGAAIAEARFDVLAAPAAEQLRQEYRRRAKSAPRGVDPDLEAALMAAGDRKYLW
jgi:hypothetical protein